MDNKPERPVLRIVARNDDLPLKTDPLDPRAEMRAFIERAFRQGQMEAFSYTTGKINGPLLREDILSHPEPQAPSS